MRLFKKLVIIATILYIVWLTMILAVETYRFGQRIYTEQRIDLVVDENGELWYK